MTRLEASLTQHTTVATSFMTTLDLPQVIIFMLHSLNLCQLCVGHYWLQSSPGYAVKVFCDMERVCGCSGGGGGWMRVAHIDMTQLNQDCPAGFRNVTASGKTICGGQSSRCISTTFSPHGLQYNRVRGRITGYQYYTTNGFYQYTHSEASIDTYFVDGIVLTYGSPRTHIWTFVSGFSQYYTGPSGCPCNGDSYTHSLPPYVGNDYFCESGHPHDSRPPSTHILTNDPLWLCQWYLLYLQLSSMVL